MMFSSEIYCDTERAEHYTTNQLGIYLKSIYSHNLRDAPRKMFDGD